MSRTKEEATGDGGMRSGTRMSQENRKEGGSGKEEEETEDNGEDDREERRGRRIVSWWLEAPSPRLILSLSLSLSSFCFHDGKAGLHTRRTERSSGNGGNGPRES